MESKEHNTTGNDRINARLCRNCYYPLPRFGQYCSHCGQKYTDGRVTIGSLIRDFLSDTLNLDAKIWRTLLALFVPGKLTRTFFEGKQQRYVRPLRLFFVFAIITIAGVNFFEAEFAQDFFLDLDEEYSEDIHYSSFITRLDTTSTNLKDSLPQQHHYVLDSLQVEMIRGFSDSTEIGLRLNLSDASKEITSYKIAKKDIADLPIEEISEKYGVTDFWDKLLLRQNLRVQQQGDNFAAYMLNQVIWMMLLIMPILALYMKLLYVRRSYYYVEHLIFSFHVHAFLFLVLTVLMLLDNYQAIADHMENIWIGGLVLMQWYFYRALRTVYRQSRFKTIMKFLILNFLYLLTFIVAVVITIIIAALLY